MTLKFMLRYGKKKEIKIMLYNFCILKKSHSKNTNQMKNDKETIR